MKNIFICFTPYHVLLSCGIALDCGNSAQNYLFVISDFRDATYWVHLLKDWNQSPFTQIECLPGIYDSASIFRRCSTIRKNLTPITQFVSKHGADCVFVFNDGRPEAQGALHFAKKSNKNATGVYVEDGLVAYSSYTSTKRPLHKLLLGKLFYGPWWKDVRVLGTSEWVDEVKAIFPQFVRPVLRLKHVTPIPKHILLELRNQKWPYEYLKALGVEITELDNLDIILIVAHSEFAKRVPEYKQSIEKILSMAKSQDLRLGVKYHPRELLDDFLSLGANGVLVLPQSLPMELLYIIAAAQIKFIIGDISTSLLTAKWLLSNVTVVSIAPLIGQFDLQLIGIFRSLGVKAVSNLEEVRGILCQ